MQTAPTAMPAKAAEFLFDQVAMTHRFVVLIDHSPYNFGTWNKVSGLQVNWSKQTYRPGNTAIDQVLPGAVSYANIVLSRAACSDSQTVKNWLAGVPANRKPLTGAIHMLDFTGQPMLTWELRQFFPINWQISAFDASSARPAIEELQLAHTGFLDNDAQARP